MRSRPQIGTAVDQNDHRLAAREVGAGTRIVPLRLFDIAPARRDDFAAIKECVHDLRSEPPLIRTTIGLPRERSAPGRALYRCVSSTLRPRVETISPRSRNAFTTSDRNRR